jgi:hypothetical protein
MEAKTILGAVSAVLAVYTFIPYIRGIFKGYTKPHAFSWIIWALVTAITSTAQIISHSGWGAAVTIVEVFATATIGVIAMFRGEKNITRGDKIAFGTALAAIPLWQATGDPFWSVMLVTAISVLGFWPTFRKSWSKPWGEVAQTYLLAGPAYVLSIAAMEDVSWTTSFYPAVLFFANIGFGMMLLTRRRSIPEPKS